jgi:acetyl-CoA carboxylase carboxyltransferase component
MDREELALHNIIARRQARMYNSWKITTSVVDKDSWFEIGALWGKTAISALARMGGCPVAIIR